MRGRRLVALLEGDIAELPLLSRAALGGEMLEAPVGLAWLGPGRAGRPLLGQMAEEAGFAELDAAELDRLLAAGGLRGLFISRSAWRRHAGRIWSRAQTTSIYIAGAGSWSPPQRLMCGADCTATADALLARVSASVSFRPHDVAVVHAVPRPPLWAQTLCGLYGFGWVPPAVPRDVTFQCSMPSNVVVDWDSPEVALRRACTSWKPDLVVLGWHRHSFPLPDRWLHRTAWRLSTELPHDVLLVPIHHGRAARP